MSSHEASHTAGHHEEPRSKSSMSASFWFVIILVGLFIAALNFINVMGNETEGHVNKEATSNQTLGGETGLGKPEENAAAHEQGTIPAAGHDTLHEESAHH